MPQNPVFDHGDTMRLDKWLWAARWFKTRAQAAAAIRAGKVRVHEVKAKAAKMICPGDVVEIRKPQQCFKIEILALAAQRRPATLAAKLYHETATSRAARLQQAEVLRLHRLSLQPPQHKPNKQQRRQLRRWQRREPPER